MSSLLQEPPALFRVYEKSECGPDGYPLAWHSEVKHMVRANAAHRCLRCHHPYAAGAGQWSPCDARCTHFGLVRLRPTDWMPDLETAEGDDGWREHDLSRIGQSAGDAVYDLGPDLRYRARYEVEAAWRILTVHHLVTGKDGKRDLRWWNLVSLCQRCHLHIQKKVEMNRVYPWEHSEWFKPYAAGWYAWRYLQQEVSRAEALERMDELLGLERAADRLF